MTPESQYCQNPGLKATSLSVGPGISWAQAQVNFTLDVMFFDLLVVVNFSRQAVPVRLEGALRLSQIAAQEAGEGRAFDEVPVHVHVPVHVSASRFTWALFSFSGLLSRSSTLPSKRSALCSCRCVSGAPQMDS